MASAISIEEVHRGNMEYAATRRSCFLLSALYDLPFGANRRFHSHRNCIAYLAPVGWSVSTVSLWDTGPYLKPISLAYVQINAFNRILSGPVGNCDVGILIRPGTGTIAGLSKTFPSHGAFSRLRFEATFTNLANYAISRHRRTDVTRSNHAFEKSAASSVTAAL